MSQDSGPAFGSGQLLRSFDQLPQKSGDGGQHMLGPLRPPVRRSDAQRGLASVAGSLGDPCEQQRTAGDRLQVLIRLGQPYKDVPP